MSAICGLYEESLMNGGKRADSMCSAMSVLQFANKWPSRLTINQFFNYLTMLLQVHRSHRVVINKLEGMILKVVMTTYCKVPSLHSSGGIVG
jgi:hypothetical protein